MSEPRLSCCITFDLDGPSSWIGTMKSRNPSILDLLDAHGVKGTFAVPGHAYAERWRAAHPVGRWTAENPDPTGELAISA